MVAAVVQVAQREAVVHQAGGGTISKSDKKKKDGKDKKSKKAKKSSKKKGWFDPDDPDFSESDAFSDYEFEKKDMYSKEDEMRREEENKKKWQEEKIRWQHKLLSDKLWEKQR